MRPLDFPLPKLEGEINCLRESDFKDGGYEFGCSSQNWDFPDSLKICQIENGKLTWLTQTKDTSLQSIITAVKNEIIPYCEGNVLVSGAHYIPNLCDLTYSGKGPQKTLDLSISTMELLRTKGCQKVDFLILIDDLYMMFDSVRLRSEEYNHYREILFNPPCLPVELARRLENYREINPHFQLLYITEKNIADRFHRYVKTIKHSDSRFINGAVFDPKAKEDWFVGVHLGDQLRLDVRVIRANKPTCPAAMAALARDVALKVSSNRQSKNYDTFVGFFPQCSIKNVTAGFRVEDIVYNTGLRTFLVFTTTKCF